MNYQAAIYQGTNGDRNRWAVYQTRSATWIFPTRYGKASAQRLADKLNRNA